MYFLCNGSRLWQKDIDKGGLSKFQIESFTQNKMIELDRIRQQNI